MSEAHDAFSTYIHVKCDGVIHAGHFVKIASGYAEEATSAQVAIGVYADAQNDAAIGDIVPVCVLGPCKVWADGTSAIVVGAYLATDSSGHAVVDTTASHKIQGMALEALATGTAFIEMLVAPSQG